MVVRCWIVHSRVMFCLPRQNKESSVCSKQLRIRSVPFGGGKLGRKPRDHGSTVRTHRNMPRNARPGRTLPIARDRPPLAGECEDFLESVDVPGRIE